MQLKSIMQFSRPPAAGSPTHLSAVQVNLTSFSVSWTQPATVTGYQVYWSGEGGYDRGNMSAEAGDKTVTLTGRTPGLTYNITIVALSDHLPSPTVGAVMVTLGEPHVLTGSVGCIDISHTLQSGKLFFVLNHSYITQTGLYVNSKACLQTANSRTAFSHFFSTAQSTRGSYGIVRSTSVSPYSSTNYMWNSNLQ